MRPSLRAWWYGSTVVAVAVLSLLPGPAIANGGARFHADTPTPLADVSGSLTRVNHLSVPSVRAGDARSDTGIMTPGGNSTVTTIPVGTNPDGAAYDRGKHKVLVAN